MDDTQLALGAQAGSEDDFAELYRRYRAGVRARIHRLGGKLVDADELTQQTFCRAWQARARFDPAKGTYLNWLLKVAQNLTLSALKRQGKEPQYCDLEQAEETGRCVSKDEPEHDHERRVIQERMRSLVCRLAPKLREPVILYFLKEMTITEVSRVLGRPVSTVWDQLLTGERQMREWLAVEGVHKSADLVA